jgi:hypothetical protein
MVRTHQTHKTKQILVIGPLANYTDRATKPPSLCSASELYRPSHQTLRAFGPLANGS